MRMNSFEIHCGRPRRLKKVFILRDLRNRQNIFLAFYFFRMYRIMYLKSKKYSANTSIL